MILLLGVAVTSKLEQKALMATFIVVSKTFTDRKGLLFVNVNLCQ